MNQPTPQSRPSRHETNGPTLRFIAKHRSIDSLQTVQLPKLSVLCGVNGSGKTHLLEAILEGKVSVVINDGQVSGDSVKFLDWTTMVPNNSQQVDAGELWRNRSEIWNKIEAQLLNNAKSIASLKTCLKEAVGDDRYADASNVVIWRVDRDELQLKTPQQEAHFDKYVNLRDHFRSKVVSSRTLAANEYAIEIAERKSGKPLFEMDRDEFESHSPLATKATDPFQQSLSELFVIYARTWTQNTLKEVEKRDGHDVDHLDEEEFVATHGPKPWDFLNELLEQGGYQFRVNQPYLYKVDQNFKAVLIHQRNDAEVDFEHLSSGEKVLISLAMLIFNTEDGRPIVEYPKVVLFDEIDSPLHPSMIRSVLDIIQDFLIERHDISVIMTTHGPSTVAIAPESSLYEMALDEPRVRKIGQTAALRLLTAGVPTLSIKSQNRRQVFVESHHDVNAYEVLHQALVRELAPSQIGLDFIASSSAKSNSGNRDAVIKMVERLEESGLETAYGIVDWDNESIPSDTTRRVMSPGGEHRYSIENFLLDPLLVTALIIRKEMYADVSREDLLGTDNQHGVLGGLDFVDANKQFLQDVVDRMLQRIKPTNPSSVDPVDVETVSGHKLTYPTWFMERKGHDLHGLYKKAIPQLGKCWNSDVGLSEAVLRSVINDVPHLVDRELLALLDRLASNDPTANGNGASDLG